MNTGRHDNDFSDGDFDRLEGAYRELPGTEPPPAVDLAVLRRARAPLRRAQRPWNVGWMHVLSTAAVLVLGIAIVQHLPDEAAREPLRMSKPPNEGLRDAASEIETLERRAVPAAEERDAAPDVEFRARQTEPGALDKTAIATGPRADQPAMAEVVTEEDAVRRERAATPTAAPMAGMTLEMEVAEQAEDPAAWLERIIELKRSEDPAWRDELAAFRATWPEHPVPEDLEG